MKFDYKLVRPGSKSFTTGEAEFHRGIAFADVLDASIQFFRFSLSVFT